ncbi:MAG: LysM domain-containing protein, partial [Desulfobacteraceae bacterium]
HFIYMVVLMTSLTGCASLGEKYSMAILEPPEKRFFEESLRKGSAFEQNRDTVAALKQYKLAMTVNPSSQEAIEGHGRVNRQINKEAKKHYKAGLKFHKEGKYGRARQEFLMALRLRPDYPEVVNMLTSRKRIKIKRYIVHTIQPGQSLSKVAGMYYGDHHKFPIIAKYNNLTDATRVHEGQKIKVPEIEGVEFLVGRETVETEETGIDYSGFWDWEAVREGATGAKAPQGDQELEEQIAIYRDHGIDLYHKRLYQEALVALNLALNMEPNDKTTLEYAYKSHFENARTLFDNRDYLQAKREFEASLKYKSDCQECVAYVKKSEDLYKEMHYKRGMQYFGKQQLKEAIQEWELVRTRDPNYKRVEYLISKAETILQNIEKIKQENRKELWE